MKFTIFMEELKKTLSLIGGIPKKDPSENNSYFQFEHRENELLINAVNEYINATAVIPLINQEGEWPKVIDKDGMTYEIFGVEVELFLGVMRAITVAKETEVTFEVKENTLIIKGRNNKKFKLPVLAVEKNIREIYEEVKNAGLSAVSFYKNISKVYPMAADSNPRIEINSVCVDFHEKGINFVSTDTTKLAISANIEKNTDYIGQLLIPKKSVPLIKKIIETTENPIIKIADNVIGIFSPSIEIYIKLLNGKYVPYKKIIPPKFDFVVSIPKKTLLETLKELSFLSEYVKIHITNDKMLLSTYRDDVKVGVEATMEISDISIEGNFQEKTIVVALRNIYPFVQNIESEQAYIGVNIETPPFKISGKPEEKFLQITMPLSVTD